MPIYKLTYLDKQGKGEPIRLLLAYGGIDYEDVRVEMDDIPKMRSTLPFGQVPTLEFDGKVMYQSLAICRYLGRINNLYGDNAWESSQIDTIVDTLYEFRLKLVAMYHETNADVKEKQYQEYSKTIIPYFMDKFESLAKENGGYLANNKLSWADFFFYGCYDALTAFLRCDIAEKYPNLGAVRDHCYSIPNIRKYVDNRPKTSPKSKSP